MMPRLSLDEDLRPETERFLVALAKTSFSGDIRADFASRLILSTDNSIYQILPQAAVFPRTEQDLVQIFRLAEQEPFQAVTFSPRGGGTGTNGQSLSQGIVLDCSRYMNQILELNLEAGWVRVQPGVVLDQLNAHLQPHGVFFAPNLAPSSRATIGGMVNTDACGKGSRVYGRTSNHVLELSWVLSDGTVARSHPISTTTLAQLKQHPGRLGNIYRQVDAIVTQKRDQIEQNFPKMPRFMTGYNLAQVYPDTRDRFNLNAILSGSEGTLAVITEAKLKLTPIPRFKTLLVVHYRCFDDALQGAQTLLKFEPAAIETIDEIILDLAKGDEIYSAVKDFVADAKTIDLGEFVDADPDRLKRRIDQVCHHLNAHHGQPQQATSYALTADATAIANLWTLRKKGVGLLGNRPGNRKPIAFIEDTAVPPAVLSPYIQDFKALLAAYQLEYAMFGHVDVGCIHVRPALDTKLPQDEVLIRQLSDRVVALVRRYGGVLWGEHGKGFRSEYTPVFFGEELYQDLRRIKAAFDPDNRLNPGKIVTSFGSDAPVVAVEAPLRGHFDRQVPASVRANYEQAFNCNGNGTCFNVNADQVMCPSYKGMNDRIHSPKGRASLLREWLRQQAILSKDGSKNGSEDGTGQQTGFAAKFAAKLWHTLGKVRGESDYSHAVHAGLQGCLSCKACATQCPIHVDIPSLKAQFLHRYYSRYLRPWRDYLLGWSETLANWQSQVPPVWNACSQTPVARWMMKQVMGLVDPPAASRQTVRQGLAHRQAPPFHLEKLSTLSAAERANSLILLQDAFTSVYEAPIVLDTYDFLTRLGYTVYVPPFFPSGKPLQVLGFLPQFAALAQQNIAYLAQLGQFDLPLIGIEPSITLAYRDEYVQLTAATDAMPRIDLLQEFLVRQLARLPQAATLAAYHLLGHCTERALVLSSQAQWQQIFQATGLSLTLVSTGCCGMAGIYGHERENYATSEAIYQLSWERQLPSSAAARALYLATGYSCRAQVRRFQGWTPLHPIQILQRQTAT